MADPVSMTAMVTAWEAMAAEAAAAAAVEAGAATAAGAAGASALAPALAGATEVGMGLTPMGGGIASAFGPEVGAASLGQQLLAVQPATQALGGITGIAGTTGAQAIPVTAWDAAMGQLGALPDTIGNAYGNLPKVGQKMVDSSVMSTLSPQPQAQRGIGSARMPNSGGGQGQASPPFDYGAPNQQLQSAASKLNISEDDLKRMLVSLRGF